MSRKKNILFCCTTGGHLGEMLCLRELFLEGDNVLFTERDKTTKNLKLEIPVKYLLYSNTTKKVSFIFYSLCNALILLWYFLYYRPKFIITTGSHIAVPFCLLSRVLGGKVIFIESIARIQTKSATGRIIEKFCDKIIVQWPEAKSLYPTGEYYGQLF